MKYVPIIPRMWTATLPKDAPRLAYGPDRSLRLISPSFWERMLPIGSILFVRHDNVGPRQFVRVYTEDEYRAYWQRKLTEAWEPMWGVLLPALERVGFKAYRTPADFADDAFNMHAAEEQLVTAVFKMLLGDLQAGDYDTSLLVTDSDKAASVESLMLLPINYPAFRQMDMLHRIAFAFYHTLPVASETVSLVISQLNSNNDLDEMHKIKFGSTQ